jgi:hypothetical protein
MNRENRAQLLAEDHGISGSKPERTSKKSKWLRDSEREYAGIRAQMVTREMGLLSNPTSSRPLVTRDDSGC